MKAPYRSDVAALTERKAAIESELAYHRAQREQLRAMEQRESHLAAELADIHRRLGATTHRSLPVLDQVRVATPCTASWDEMVGDERVRFCGSCEKNVYNLSAMTQDEAESLVRQHAHGELCIRFYQRADGTMMTEDCPVGAGRKRRKQAALAVAGAGALAFGAVAMALKGEREEPFARDAHVAAPEPVTFELRAPAAYQTARGHVEPRPDDGPRIPRPVMGGMKWRGDFETRTPPIKRTPRTK
jgi:hypothetical protein